MKLIEKIKKSEKQIAEGKVIIANTNMFEEEIDKMLLQTKFKEK